MDSSRSVVNLTTEQLYRKRALDRVNQRASRARKKSRIQELEEEVAVLKQRLARSEGHVKQLQSSEVALREAIDSARSSLQAIDASSGSQTSVLTPPSSSTMSPSIGGGSLEVEEECSPLNISLDPRKSSSPPTASQRAFEDFGAAFALRHDATGFSLNLPHASDHDTMFNFWQDSFPAELASANSFSLALDPFPSDIENNSWLAQTPDMPIPDAQGPLTPAPWERLPQHIAATCRLDTVILELTQASRRHEQQTGPIAELSEASFPSIKSLLNPESQDTHNPISNAIGQHGRITMELPNLPLKVAAMYKICVYLRWLISPTRRNYEAMPEFLRPTEAQLTVPHPPWIDIVTWPGAREKIIQYMDWSQFPRLRELSNQTISINWDEDATAIFAAKSKSELRLSAKFENHIRQLKNWTVGSIISEEFPFLDIVPTSVPEPEESTGQELC